MKKNTLLNIFAVVLAAGFFGLLAFVGQLQEDFLEEVFSSGELGRKEVSVSHATVVIAEHHSRSDFNDDSPLAERDYSQDDYVVDQGVARREAGESKVHLISLKNLDRNGDCDLKVTLIYGEPTWTSDWIEPGQTVEPDDIELSRTEAAVLSLRPHSGSSASSCSGPDRKAAVEIRSKRVPL